jgi:endoglycosylceramidase
MSLGCPNPSLTVSIITVTTHAKATRFKSKPYLLAYELINEPWVGDMYADPKLLLPGEADVKNLQGLYAALHKAIRKIDNETILMYVII